MKTFARYACVAAGAAMLCGCQSFPLTSWMFKGKRPAAEPETMMAANTSGSLEEGRAALRNGNISAAIGSFSVAQMDQSTRAEATNGLAVAYAKLGRNDLAERYFRAAIAAAPDNPRFAANLLRLESQVALAQQNVRPAEPVASGAGEAAQPEVAAADTLSGPATRISRGEVHIQSRTDSYSAPAMAVAYKKAPDPKPAVDAKPEAKEPADQVAAASTDKNHPATIVFGE